MSTTVPSSMALVAAQGAIARVEQNRQDYVVAKVDQLLPLCALQIQEHCRGVLLQALVFTYTAKEMDVITQNIFQNMTLSIKDAVIRLLHARQDLFVNYGKVVAKMSAVFMAHGFNVWIAYSQSFDDFQDAVRLMVRAVERDWTNLEPFIQEMEEAIKGLQSALANSTTNALDVPRKAKVRAQLWAEMLLRQAEYSDAEQKHKANLVMQEFLGEKQAKKQDRIDFIEKRLRDNQEQHRALTAKRDEAQKAARDHEEYHKEEKKGSVGGSVFFGLIPFGVSGKSGSESTSIHKVNTSGTQALCNESMERLKKDHAEMCELRDALVQGKEDDKVAVEKVANLYAEECKKAQGRYYAAAEAYNKANTEYTATVMAAAGLQVEDARQIAEIVNHLTAFATHVLPVIDAMNSAKLTVVEISKGTKRPSLAQISNAMMPLADCAILNDIISSTCVGKAKHPSVVKFFLGVQEAVFGLAQGTPGAASVPSPLPSPSSSSSSSSSATAQLEAPPVSGGMAAVDEYVQSRQKPKAFLF